MESYLKSSMHGTEVAQFIINICLIIERLRDLLPQEFTESFAQAMHRHFHSPFTHAQLFRRLGMGRRIVTHQPRLQRLELNRPASPVLCSKRGHRTIHHCDGPFSIKRLRHRSGCGIVDHERRRTFRTGIQRFMRHAATTLLPARMILQSDDEVFHRSEQIAAESSALRIGPGESTLQQMREKRMRVITSRVRGKSRAPQEDEDGLVIRRTQVTQRHPALG